MTMSVEQTPSGRPAEAPGCRASESLEIDAIVDCAYEAARLLKLLANEKRLVILCFLATRGEMPSGPWSRPLGSASPPCRSIWPNCAATDSFSFAASPRPCIIGSPIRALCACLVCSKRSFARGVSSSGEWAGQISCSSPCLTRRTSSFHSACDSLTVLASSPIVTPSSVITTSGHSVHCGHRVNFFGSIVAALLDCVYVRPGAPERQPQLPLARLQNERTSLATSQSTSSGLRTTIRLRVFSLWRGQTQDCR